MAPKARMDVWLLRSSYTGAPPRKDTMLEQVLNEVVVNLNFYTRQLRHQTIVYWELPVRLTKWRARSALKKSLLSSEETAHFQQMCDPRSPMGAVPWDLRGWGQWIITWSFSHPITCHPSGHQLLHTPLFTSVFLNTPNFASHLYNIL